MKTEPAGYEWTEYYLFGQRDAFALIENLCFDLGIDLPRIAFGYQFEKETCDAKVFWPLGTDRSPTLAFATYGATLDVICHELAHVALGAEEEHGLPWHDAFTMILERARVML